jgi:type IV pilus assembly protein PilN
MKIHVNLATRPFVEMRPYILRLRWVMAGLAVVSLALIVSSHLLQKKLDAAQVKMNAIQTRTNAAVSEKQANERRMRQPANAAVLDRAHFLNTLFLRKSFSWTAVMMDLETVLPSGVQVTSIEPSVTADGDVIIRMRVAGDRDRAVQLVRNLEHSRRFLQPRLNSEAVQAKDQGQGNVAATAGGVEFEILADYNPLPEGQPFARAKLAAALKGDEVEEKPKPVEPLNRSVQHTPVVPDGHPGVTLKPMPPMTPRPQIPAQKPSPQVPVGSQSPAELQWPVLGPAVEPTQTGGVA